MFVSFLYPFPLRGRRASFLWVAYKQMGDLGPDGVQVHRQRRLLR